MPVQTRSRRGHARNQEGLFSSSIHCLSSCVGNAWDSYCEGDCRLKPTQIMRLGEHKYVAVDTSWLDELCMKRFWNAAVEYCPLWVAPNLITLIGLIINLLTVLILSHFCFSATETAPAWAYLQAAMGLFVYQTLDAIDGKQARRTNSASALGELFDHGCDSMTQVFVTLNICYSMQMGAEKNLVLLVVAASVVIFYCAHWSTYCTGQLRFAKFDVTEAQFVVIGVLLLSAFFGPKIWSVPILGFKLRIVAVAISFFLSLWQLGGYLRVILSEGVGKNGSTVAGTSVLFPLFPLLAVCVPFAMIYSKSTSGVYDRNITLLCLCFGAVAAKATNRLVIAHMSRSELELWDWIYVSPFLMILNQYYDFVIDEYKLLVFSTIYAYISLIIFCVLICRQFCDYLQIHCFTLSRPPPRPDSSTSTTASSSGTTQRTSPGGASKSTLTSSSSRASFKSK